MNVTLKQLRAFVAIAEVGSFAHACELLFTSQPALSSSIRKLEDSVGGRLLERSTRRVETTPEGRDFLPVARRLLADWDEAFSDLGRLFTMQRGRLSIAVMPSFASSQFPLALARFQQQYPEIDLTIRDLVMEGVIQAVREGRVDLGITFEPGAEEAVEFLPLFIDSSIAIVPPGHPLSRRRKLRWTDLVNYPFIALNTESAYRRWMDQAWQAAGLEGSHTLEANQLATVIRMVSVGIGVSVVPALCRNQVETLGARVVEFEAPGMTRRVGIYLRKRQAVSVAAQRMIEVLQEEFGSISPE